ncbi:MAG: hypothetical protein U0232_31820 [Thermomicrobiales bacterium]
MRDRCPGFPEAIADAALIAGQCTFELDFGRHVFPAAPVPSRPDGSTPTPNECLRSLCRGALTDRYGEGDLALWRNAARQLGRLAVIAKLDLAGFFLLVHEVVSFAKRNGIPCQGRGSAAGSVVSHTLGISRVEPLSNRLLFERFLSEERAAASPTSTSTSGTPAARRSSSISTGPTARSVGMACTMQTYHLRGAVRDVGKVLAIWARWKPSRNASDSASTTPSPSPSPPSSAPISPRRPAGPGSSPSASASSAPRVTLAYIMGAW